MVAVPTSTADTFGAMLIGALTTMAIYGITTLQTYYYYMTYPKDGVATKLLVALIWILDTIHIAFMCHAVHYYLIDGFSNRALLVNGTWTLFGSIAVNVVVAFIVQAFFTHRIYLLCSQKFRIWVAGIIGFFVVGHFGFGLSTAVQLGMKKRFTSLQEVSLSSVLPFGITTILSDIFIAAALCVLLASNRSTFKDTNSIINKLIIYAINRCILTCAIAIVETIVFTVVPNTFYSFAIDFIVGKLYANSLLAVLNSRKKLRSEGGEEAYTSTELSTRFIVSSSAVAGHQADSFQVRSRDVHKTHDSVDLEKAASDDGERETAVRLDASDPSAEESYSSSSRGGSRVDRIRN